MLYVKYTVGVDSSVTPAHSRAIRNNDFKNGVQDMTSWSNSYPVGIR